MPFIAKSSPLASVVLEEDSESIEEDKNFGNHTYDHEKLIKFNEDSSSKHSASKLIQQKKQSHQILTNGTPRRHRSTDGL